MRRLDAGKCTGALGGRARSAHARDGVEADGGGDDEL